MKVSGTMLGKNLQELNIRAKYGCNVMAIRRGEEMNISPRAEDRLAEGDVLVIVGRKEHLTKLEMAYQ
ncbi:Ktr system potassium uptake protein A [compost metagenome]